jgi:hypothetical protein
MAVNIWPADAVSSAPNYTGRMLRQTTNAPFMATPARPLGALSGIMPATPSGFITSTSSTWTVGVHRGVLDMEASAVAGAYVYSIDAAVTGSVTAADPSNPRVDSLCIQLSDPAEGDGTTNPGAAIVYTAGIPGATGGARGAAGGPPNVPARSLELAQITVPKVGAGSPVVSMVAPYATTAGGILPVANQAARDALSAFNGLSVWRMDIQRVETYNGTAWAATSPTANGTRRWTASRATGGTVPANTTASLVSLTVSGTDGLPGVYLVTSNALWGQNAATGTLQSILTVPGTTQTASDTVAGASFFTKIHTETFVWAGGSFTVAITGTTSAGTLSALAGAYIVATRVLDL